MPATFYIKVQRVAKRKTIRIHNVQPFRLHWSADSWTTAADVMATAISVGINYVDIDTRETASTSIVFTFYWLDDQRWEGRDYTVQLS